MVNGITDSMDMSVSKLWEIVQDREARHAAVNMITKIWTQLRDWKTATTYLGFLGGSVVKDLPANAGDLGSILGLGRSPGGGHGNPLQYSCLWNPTDREAWQATVYGAAKSQTQLSDWAQHSTLLVRGTAFPVTSSTSDLGMKNGARLLSFQYNWRS